MSLTLSLGALKEQLLALGVHTATPGLSGDERLRELNLRLNLALNRETLSSRESAPRAAAAVDDEPTTTLSHLSMAEIRSRLAALGVDTSTPGLTGDARRDELMKRLVSSICGESGGDGDMAENIIDDFLDQNSLSVIKT